MKKQLIHVLMAIMVGGLFLTVSCAKKTVVSNGTSIESQSHDKGAEMTAQQIKEKMAKEQAIKNAKMMAAKKRFLNQNILFAYDSATLNMTAKDILKEKASWLGENSSVKILIEGHCDERGTTEYNLALGERRAIAVRNYLMNLGVSGYRMKMLSYGEERPLDSASNEMAYKKNRRAQFVIQ